MKKLLFIAVLAVTYFTANAQDFKPVKVGLGLGYASPAGEGSKVGVLIYLEPAYRIKDEILVGLRIESALMGRSVDGVDSDVSISANGSYSLFGQYYFSNSNFRPFAGLGFGLFSLGSVELGSDSGEVSGGSKIGAFPRVGFNLGGFNFSIDYNLIPSTESVLFDENNPLGTESEVKNNYLGVRLGFSLGGGKK